MYMFSASGGRFGHICMLGGDRVDQLKLLEDTQFKLSKPHSQYTCVWTRLCRA